MKEAARQIKEADAEMIQAARKMKGMDNPAEKPGTSGDPKEVQEMVSTLHVCIQT